MGRKVAEFSHLCGQYRFRVHPVMLKADYYIFTILFFQGGRGILSHPPTDRPTVAGRKTDTLGDGEEVVSLCAPAFHTAFSNRGNDGQEQPPQGGN